MKYHYYLSVLLFSLCFGKTFSQSPNWAEDIAPIFYNKCAKCHNPNGVAPFSLITYQDGYINRQMIKYVVSNRFMPPWPPDPTYRHFADERLLTDQEINAIAQWADDGGPQGNPSLAPPPPVFNAGGEIVSPDFTGQIPTYTINTTIDLYRCFVIPTSFGTDRYITEMEIIPGNRGAVHHVLVFQDPTNTPVILDNNDPGPGYTNYGGTGSNQSELIGAWVPGQGVYKFPSGMGVKLTPGANIVLQVHYPGGISGELDSTQIRLKLTTTPLRQVYFNPPLNHYLTITNGPLIIPANTTRTFYEEYTVPYSVSVLGVAPHMHLIGREIKSWGITPSNDTIPLINIPEWQFNWQGVYNFRNVLKIPAGTTIYAEATYDNTSSNPFNPNNPPQTVFVGEGTTDEMMLVYFSYLLYFPGDENIVIDSSAIVHVGIENQEAPLIAVTPQLYDPVPNPAQENVKVSFYLPAKGDITFTVTDINGRVVSIPYQNYTCMPGINFMQLQVSDMPSGIYFLTLQYGNTVRVKRLVKS